jgi:hypothetical protein
MFNLRKILQKATAGDNRESKTDHMERLVAALHNRTAHYLNQKTAGWSPKKLKTALVIFCLTAGNLILFIASREVLKSNGPPINRRSQKVYKPNPLAKPGPADSNKRQLQPP